MFKRSQQEVSDGSKHWYQDKYQHVLTQRNILALIAIVALATAAIAALVVMRLAPLKSVEPYLLEIDEKTGVTQRVNPLSRADYAASEAVDRYFTSTYIRLRESYNISILRYNYNIVRLMSASQIFRDFSAYVNPANEDGFVHRLGGQGQREVKIRSMVYIVNPADKGKRLDPTRSKVLQAKVTTIETVPNTPTRELRWVITVTFEYANLSLNEEDQLLNPIGYTVTSYQIHPEIE